MKIRCNCCGRELRLEHDMLVEDLAVIEKEWGYFSKKDGEHHKFRLCEACYDKLIQGFVVPVEITGQTELV